MMSEASPEMPYSRNVSCAGLHGTFPLWTKSSQGKSVKWPSRQASKKRTDKADGLMLPLALVQPSCRYSVLMVLLCRTTARADAAKPSDGMSVLLVDMREAVGNGLTIRPVRTMLNHAT